MSSLRIGGLLAALIVAISVWVAALWRRRRATAAEFSPAETTAELARVGPARATVTVVVEQGDMNQEARLGQVPLLACDGRLLRRGKRFYIGKADGQADGTATALRGRGEAVLLDIRHGGTRFSLSGRVVGRRRLSRLRRRKLDVPTDECFAVVPSAPLVKKQDRDAVRYYLSAPTEEHEEVCTHLAMDAHAHRIDRAQCGDGAAATAALVPWRGASQLKASHNPRDAIRAIVDDLDRVPTRDSECWVAQWMADGGLESRGRWRVAGSTADGTQLDLSRRVEYVSAPLTEDSPLLLMGYRSREHWKSLTARLDAVGDGTCIVAPRSLPTADRGHPVEVLDFSLTGLRIVIPVEGAAYLLGRQEGGRQVSGDVQVCRHQLAELEGGEVGLSLYPRFLFPPQATELVPDLMGHGYLRATVGRVEMAEDGPELLAFLGLECSWEPASYDDATGLPARWRRLKGNRESSFLSPIHRALNQLSGQLERGEPMGMVG